VELSDNKIRSIGVSKGIGNPMALALHSNGKQVTMTEGRAINKYTLVPLTMVLGAVVATTAVTNYLWADKTQLAILQAETASLRREFETYKEATDDKLDIHLGTLHRMDVAIKLIAQKLDVVLPADP